MQVAPTAILSRAVANNRRRIVLKILKMGNTPIRVKPAAPAEQVAMWGRLFGLRFQPPVSLFALGFWVRVFDSGRR